MDALPLSSHARMSYPAGMASTGDEDAALMLRYRDGDARAFDLLYARHRGPLFRYFLRQCSQRAKAEELYQEVWAKIVKARASYHPGAKFTTWMYRIARNTFVDSLRRSGNDPLSIADGEETTEQLAGAASVEAQAGAMEFGEQLAAALGALPQEQREAFLLREEGGLSLEAIAQVTDVGRETVKSRLRYAVGRLREALDAAGVER